MQVELHEEALPSDEVSASPFYHCKQVNEEDPNYLLKVLTLQPERGYIPTFLRGQEVEESSEGEWLGTYESS